MIRSKKPNGNNNRLIQSRGNGDNIYKDTTVTSPYREDCNRRPVVQRVTAEAEECDLIWLEKSKEDLQFELDNPWGTLGAQLDELAANAGGEEVVNIDVLINDTDDELTAELKATVRKNIIALMNIKGIGFMRTNDFRINIKMKELNEDNENDGGGLITMDFTYVTCQE